MSKIDVVAEGDIEAPLPVADWSIADMLQNIFRRATLHLHKYMFTGCSSRHGVDSFYVFRALATDVEMGYRLLTSWHSLGVNHPVHEKGSPLER